MTKILIDEAVVRQAQQVPLHELLAKVPADARLVIQDADGFGTSFIPVGKYCQEAATVIRQAIADAALDKMADNARELGLTYDAPVAQIDTSPERVEKEAENVHEQPDRQVLQAAGVHPSPCARHCEANAFEIAARGMRKQITELQAALAARPAQETVALESVYETIIQWDEGGGKRSRRELARRIVALYTPQPPAQPLTDEQKDATRWRYMRQKHANWPAIVDRASDVAFDGGLDEAVDEAIAAHGITKGTHEQAN